MIRYPFLSFLIKTVAVSLLLFFLGMIYWSFTLQEEHLIRIRSDLDRIRYDLTESRETLQSIKRQLVSGVKSPSPSPETQETSAHSPYPNLLKPDPFMQTTLATLLPEHFAPHGTFSQATYGKPDNLHPFSPWAEVNVWTGLCSLANARMHVGIYEKYAPYAALSIEERPIVGKGYPEFYVRLRENIYFEPLEKRFFPDTPLSDHFLKRHQVTADDFKFYFDAIMNPGNQEPGAIALRTYLSDIEEIKVIDPQTFTVRWKPHKVIIDGKETEKIKYIARMWTGALRPLPRFVYQYFADGTKIIENDQDPDTYRTNTVFAQNFSRHFAKNIIPSCGPWLFDGMTDREIRFRRNPSFFEQNAALGDARVVSFRNSPDSIWQDFKADLLDNYILPPDQEIEFADFLKSERYLEQKKNGSAIKELQYLNHAFSWIGWNQENALFKSRNVRRALTQAIDRKRLINENLSGNAVPIHGPFFVTSEINDPNISPWPFDPLRAKKILADEGWKDLDGDGFLEKMIDGKMVKFSFALTYFVKNPTTKATAEFIANSLKNIGIDMHLKGVDIADLALALDDKSFDAVILAWGQGTPPEDPRQLWHSSQAKLRSSSNVVAFANQEADRIIDALDYEYDKEKRLALYRQFDKIMHEEQPYTFLYTPLTRFLYRERLQNVFLPIDRKDLIPGANVSEPDSNIFWLKG